jgi:hypothetical protein
MAVSKSIGIKALVATALLAAVAAPQVSLAQVHRAPDTTGGQTDTYFDPGSQFKCDNGNNLIVHFSTRNAKFYAVVDAGNGPHALLLKPSIMVDDQPEIVWSDGQRTLTWAAGVKLMFMEGPAHVMCGRSHMHEEE